MSTALFSQGANVLTELLQNIERNELPTMLREPIDQWRSVDITFHPPHVERLWRPWRNDYRINLQIIHPCKREESLNHPHATPIAIRIVKERYRMFTGYGSDDQLSSDCYYFDLVEGTYYEMIHPDAWHAECPVEKPVMTIALTGKPWPRWAPKSPHALGELSATRKAEIIVMFAQIYA